MLEWLEVRNSNPIAEAMHMVEKLCQSVVMGQRAAAYFSGPPGIGKSYNISRVTKKRFLACNPTNYLSLLKSIEQAQDEGKALFLDEADVIFRSERMANVLKTATGARDLRYWDGECVDVPGGIFVATNQNLLDRSWMERSAAGHCSALFSRANPITIPDDILQLWEYSIALAQTGGLLRVDYCGMPINLDTVNRAFDWFTVNVYRLDTVSPRTLHQIASDMNQHRLGRMDADLENFYLRSRLTRQSNQSPPPTPFKITPSAGGPASKRLRKAASRPVPAPVETPKPSRERVASEIGVPASNVVQFMKRWEETMAD
jgi:hypothetical protein